MTEASANRPGEPEEPREPNPPPGTPPEAVKAVGHLGLGGFFLRHRDHILDKLEECDDTAQKAKTSRDMIFFAESLPLIDGLIRVGTIRDEYKGAEAWVRQSWGQEIEPSHVLSALTFLYVAKTGEAIANGTYVRQPDEPKPKFRSSDIWARINGRVAKLEPPEPEPAIS